MINLGAWTWENKYIIPVYLTRTHHMAKYGQLNGKHTELFEIFENLLWNLILYKTQKPFFLKEGNGKLMLYNSHLCWHALPMLRFLCLVP